MPGILCLLLASQIGGRVDKDVWSVLHRTGTPGATVLALRDSQPIYSHAFGLRQREGGLPARMDTHYEIGSITKQFTAAAILQLRDAGKLDIVKPVAFQQIMDLVAGKPLDFPPGTKASYSNTGYIMLGRIIELTSNESYRHYIRTHLLRPAGMTNTFTVDDETSLPTMAKGYRHLQGKLERGITISETYGWSAGSLVCTVGELEKWNQALVSGKIVSKADYAEMTDDAAVFTPSLKGEDPMAASIGPTTGSSLVQAAPSSSASRWMTTEKSSASASTASKADKRWLAFLPMAKPFTEWTVLPHGALEQLDDRLMTVSGNIHMPLVDFPRRMTVARLDGGRLVVFSAIALDEPEMSRLEAFGTPAYLVVPNERHRMDIKIWKDRYPAMQVIAPPGARKEVAEIVPVDATEADFGDPHVRLLTVPGMAERELALEVRTPQGTTLVINEFVFNVGDLPGVSGLFAKAMGITGPEPKIPALTRLASVKDKGALSRQLRSWASLAGLKRILVSHGSEITKDPSGTLLRLADSLGHEIQ
jgi:Beta-lactamase